MVAKQRRRWGGYPVSLANLHGSWPEQAAREANLARGRIPEQLAIKVVAVRNNDDGWVLHFGGLHHPGSEAGHGDTFARTLGMPNHPLVRAARP